jgi:YggT family protein
MNMQVFLFLLDTVFFVLVAAAFLRAWMNHLRVQMQGQPGRFAIAVTDWLVRPVRRVLPKALSQSRFDWGSVMSAVLLALGYGGLWLALATGMTSTGASPLAMIAGIATVAGTFLLRVILQGLMVLLFMYAVLSWVQPGSPVMGTLDRLVAPVLRPVRKIVPMIGGVDLSVLVLLLLLQVALMLVGM